MDGDEIPITGAVDFICVVSGMLAAGWLEEAFLTSWDLDVAECSYAYIKFVQGIKPIHSCIMHHSHDVLLFHVRLLLTLVRTDRDCREVKQSQLLWCSQYYLKPTSRVTKIRVHTIA